MTQNSEILHQIQVPQKEEPFVAKVRCTSQTANTASGYQLAILGGALGYLIGYALFPNLALPIIDFYHYQVAFVTFQQKFAQYGLWIILIKGLTPVPYKIVTIAAGAAAFNFPLFMAARVITRGGRFLLEAVLLRQFGQPAQAFIERRLGLVTGVFVILLVAGFLVLKYA